VSQKIGHFIKVEISDLDQIFFTASCHSKNTTAKNKIKIAQQNFAPKSTKKALCSSGINGKPGDFFPLL
jgi:hypothetical protein